MNDIWTEILLKHRSPGLYTPAPVKNKWYLTEIFPFFLVQENLVKVVLRFAPFDSVPLKENFETKLIMAVIVPGKFFCVRVSSFRAGEEPNRVEPLTLLHSWEEIHGVFHKVFKIEPIFSLRQ